VSDHLTDPLAVPGVAQERDGCLSPWAAAAADAPGWQIITRSRHLAVAVAATVSGGTVHCHKEGEWQARIPQAVLM